MPNGGKRQRGAAGRIRAEGGKKGYPDILLDAARGAYHGCRIEMKSPEDKNLSRSAGTLRIPAHREQPFRLNVNTYSAPT